MTPTVLPKFSLSQLWQRSDLAFAVGMLMIVILLVIPLPKIMLDIFLAISITFSVLILMTSLFIIKPLDFSSFPTILLVATMIRLSLNVASTRLILSHGHEGSAAAGKVIEAFGHFVMGGNFVIGIIVFTILVIINFVVITKGSGRIAEVSARFSLDAMPGKQMAIDADLSAGLIKEDDARKRRKELELESNFFGAMDGAAKFVRGDAIAGLLITIINIVGGIIIGVAQNNMTFLNASRAYTLLTVGDGLVNQIPALIVSTAAGMLVSKAGVEGTADKAVFNQLSAYPSALGMSAFVMLAMSVLPGIPFIPFALIALTAGALAWQIYKKQAVEQIKNNQSDAKIIDGAANTTADNNALPSVGQNAQASIIATPIEPICLELGYGLLPLLNDEKGSRLPEQIKNLRQQLSREYGLLLPAIRIQDNLNLDQNVYIIRIKELEAGKGELRIGQLFVMDPTGQMITLPGEKAFEPSFGLPGMWIEEKFKNEAEAKGYTIVPASTVLMTHLSELVKDNIAELLTFADVQNLLEALPEVYKKLLNDIVPNNITVGGIQRILQTLVNERVSIRDLTTILEGIAEACSFSRNINTIIEHVRLRLARQITYANADYNGNLTVITMAPSIENMIANALHGEGEVKQLALPPHQLQEFINKTNQVFDKFTMLGENPVLITSAYIRPYIRSILERTRPAAVIMSQSEVHPKVRIRNIGQII